MTMSRSEAAMNVRKHALARECEVIAEQLSSLSSEQAAGAEFMALRDRRAKHLQEIDRLDRTMRSTRQAYGDWKSIFAFLRPGFARGPQEKPRSA